MDSAISASWEQATKIDLENLGGQIRETISIHAKSTPYVIKTDITVMPGATLFIYPGVVMEFAPNVGILVLGTIQALGTAGNEIVMRPWIDDNSQIAKSYSKRSISNMPLETIRLCKEGKCTSQTNEGFLEFFNRTTLQWIPLCDYKFTERNAQVACQQLGHDPMNVFVSRDRRYELHPGSLTRIWSWPEPLQVREKVFSLFLFFHLLFIL